MPSISTLFSGAFTMFHTVLSLMVMGAPFSSLKSRRSNTIPVRPSTTSIAPARNCIYWACTQSAYGLFFWQYRERINHFTCSVTLREFWLQ